jgi:hypothetical protein
MKFYKLSVIKAYEAIIEIRWFYDDCINKSINPYQKQKP